MQEATGTIINWSSQSGWGFLKSDSGQKYFLHFKNCEIVPRTDDGFVDFRRGNRVSFICGEPQEAGKAPVALNVNSVTEGAN